MNISVIGATGNTGQKFVEQALERGHRVTVLVRSPEKLTIHHDNLSVLQGDVLNANDVMQAVNGQDAVFIALGTGKSPIKTTIRTDGTRQVVEALAQSNEQAHLVVLSSLGAGNSQKQIRFYWRWLLNIILGKAFADHTTQEQVVQTSNLPYTILRPTSLSDEPGIGTDTLRVSSAPQVVAITPALPRDDVASFALDAIETRTISNDAVALTRAG